MRVNLPLIDRTVERTQGCWNCFHAETDATKVMERWKTVDRPKEEARVAEAKQIAASSSNIDPGATARAAKTGRNDPCPCGSGGKYKRCHLEKDREADRVMKRIEGVENADRILRNLDVAIAEGIYAICKNRVSPKYDTYTNHRFLCNQWSGAQGASVARAGQTADMLPEEIKDVIGDGN